MLTAALPMFQLFVHSIRLRLNPASQPYFKATREIMFSSKLEDLAPPGPVRAQRWVEAEAAFDKVLGWLEAGGKDAIAFGGNPNKITFADFIIGSYLITLQRVSEPEDWARVMGWKGGKWAKFMERLQPYIKDA